MSYYAYTPSRHNERPDPADMQRPDREQQYHLERKYRVFYVFSYLKRLASHLVHILGSSEDFKKCSTLFSAVPNAHQGNTAGMATVGIFGMLFLSMLYQGVYIILLHYNIFVWKLLRT